MRVGISIALVRLRYCINYLSCTVFNNPVPKSKSYFLEV